MRRWIVLFLFAGLISGATLGAFWCGKTVCHKITYQAPSSWQRNLYSKMNLPAEREQKLQSIDEAFWKQTRSFCMDLCRERMELMELIASDQAAPADIHRKIEEIGRAQTQLEKKIAHQILKVKAMLNDNERKEYVQALRKEFERSMNECGFGEILR
ncbi:MAG: periplasmic heavy metal sensor [Candidatus Omnitrophica bacterium]|nr:periplasmic heavy metal sensor [Candidatus Omnitrophota bacterium]